jgi:uncharacterized protein
LVPPALAIQEFDGTSWVGLVPFRMADVMARGLPAVAGLSDFPEMNLRLYVQAEDKPGVWFVSLDATSSLAVWGARRFLHLPYFRAAMTARDDGGRINYESVRRSPSLPRVAFRGAFGSTGPAAPAGPGTLARFLTERYCLYACTPAGGLRRVQIHHAPWPLQPARADIIENTVGEAQGISLAGAPALLHFSRRVDVVTWAPETVPAG